MKSLLTYFFGLASGIIITACLMGIALASEDTSLIPSPLESWAKETNEYVSSIYNYTPTKDNSTRPISDIIAQGGDCYDYSRLYVSLASDIGLDAHIETYSVTYNISVPPSQRKGHAFTLVYDETGYCIMDLNEYYCFARARSNGASQ